MIVQNEVKLQDQPASFLLSLQYNDSYNTDITSSIHDL